MIYFDNASTSLQKPEKVALAVYEAIKNGSGNPGRGANRISMDAGRVILNCRLELMKLLQGDKSENVIFKSSVTESLNTMILGLLKQGDHVITSVMEHNSVLRPLESLRMKGIITYDLIGTDSNGKINIEEIKSLEKPETRAVILSHVSNLTGSIQPLEKVRELLFNKEIFIIADCAQSAGYINVGIKNLNVDAIAFTGHKGLLGPQGTGGFLLNDRLNSELQPIFTGGTGSDSLSLLQPSFLPDKFEAGTHNTPGISGLFEGVKHINNISIDMIIKKNRILMTHFIEEISLIHNLEIQGSLDIERRIPNFSLKFKNLDSSEAAFLLETQYEIITRSGYHCAPLAHKALGTEHSGTVRISFGHYTTLAEIDDLLAALRILSEV
ncbi:MAG: aminotransferase class V-fold PLP-dependent enzyme [Clostridiaceae bacterium]